MVSFFGIRLGSDRKKSPKPTKPPKWNAAKDPRLDDLAPPRRPPSRPGSCSTSRPASNWRAVFRNPAMASSMHDLTQSPRGLQHHASESNLRPRRASLVLPPPPGAARANCPGIISQPASPELDPNPIGVAYPSPPPSDHSGSAAVSPMIHHALTFPIAAVPSPVAFAPRASDERPRALRGALARRDTLTFHQPRRESVAIKFDEGVRRTRQVEGFSGNFAEFDFGDILKSIPRSAGDGRVETASAAAPESPRGEPPSVGPRRGFHANRSGNRAPPPKPLQPVAASEEPSPSPFPTPDETRCPQAVPSPLFTAAAEFSKSKGLLRGRKPEDPSPSFDSWSDPSPRRSAIPAPLSTARGSPVPFLPCPAFPSLAHSVSSENLDFAIAFDEPPKHSPLVPERAASPVRMEVKKAPPRLSTMPSATWTPRSPVEAQVGGFI